MDQKYWENLVAGAIRVKRPEDVQQIARLCVETQQSGLNASAWHASAQFYGYLHRCHCFPCEQKRKQAA